MTSTARILFAEDEPLRLTMEILGPAATQGSKTPIRNKFGQIVGSRESSKRSRPWRQDVRAMMEAARPEGFLPWDEAVTMSLTIYMRRPKAHFDSKGRLKQSAPPFPPNGLDIDKVQRCIGDAAKGIWITDDRRISKWHDPQRFYCAPGEVERTVITCELRQE